MVALRSDLRLEVPGGRIVASAEPGPATWLPDGTRLVLLMDAPGKVALDGEPKDTSVPSIIVDALPADSPDSAARIWTALEVVAKLTDWPVLALLREMPPAQLAGLSGAVVETEWDGRRLAITRCDTDSLWIAWGRVD